MWQYGTGIALLVMYIIVALGTAVEIVPRGFFRHPVERFIVRVSCGLLWPLFLGHLIAWAASAEVERDEIKTLKDGSHVFDPIHNGADECECGLVRSASVHVLKPKDVKK